MKIKLSDKHKEVINKMRKGDFGENSVTNNESAYLATKEMRRHKVSITVFKNLEDKKLVEKVKYNFALDRYYLTELGKTIDLNQ